MSLRTVEYCVLDEADRLFEMGFMEQVGGREVEESNILRHCLLVLQYHA
jgi:superfamily II DNA/RNA helicase